MRFTSCKFVCMYVTAVVLCAKSQDSLVSVRRVHVVFSTVGLRAEESLADTDNFHKSQGHVRFALHQLGCFASHERTKKGVPFNIRADATSFKSEFQKRLLYTLMLGLTKRNTVPHYRR